MATIDKIIRSVVIKDSEGNTVSTVPIGTEAELVIFDDSVGESEDTSYAGQTLDPILERKLAEKANIEYYTNDGVSLGKIEDSTLGKNSVAIGNEVTASGIYSQAFGNNTVASGSYSHAEGSDTQALGYETHAEGCYTIAEGNYSHAEGYGGPDNIEKKAKGIASHIEGYQTHAEGNYSHAEGLNTITIGISSHAEGEETQTTNIQAHAEGYDTTASGPASHAEGARTIASGGNAHTEGAETTASNTNAHAEGGKTIASGEGAHAEGYGWKLNGITTYVTASGTGSHAEGLATSAIATAAHSEGQGTTAKGNCSHAEGQETIAEGAGSHAGGYASKATKMFSFAHGYHVTASGDNQFVVGQYNKEDSNQIFIVGTGDANNRNNAFTVNFNGNSNANGTLFANGLRSYENLTVDGSGSIKGNLGIGEDLSVGKKLEVKGHIAFPIESNSLGNRIVISQSIATHGSTWPALSIYGITPGAGETEETLRIALDALGVIAAKQTSITQLDYAEYIYPWCDSNINNEDRVGYFVTIKDKLLYKANSNEPICGITSETYGVLGSPDALGEWSHKYLKDEFGRILLNEQGGTIISEEYNEHQEYISRKERAEWSAVGLMGQICVRDDGTCIPGQYCKCADGGIATLAEKQDFNTWLVLERTGDNVVKVLFK